MIDSTCPVSKMNTMQCLSMYFNWHFLVTCTA